MHARFTALTLDSIIIGDAKAHRLGGADLLTRLLDVAAEYLFGADAGSISSVARHIGGT